MIKAIERTARLVDQLEGVGDPTIVIERFAAFVRDLGFSHFIMTGLPAYGGDVEKLIVANGWPREWTERYRERRYFADDPVSQAAFTCAAPYTWRQAREPHSQCERARQIEGEAREFGLADGLAIPFLDPNNWQSVVSLAADHPVDASPHMLVLLQGAVPLVHRQLSSLLGGEATRFPRLTAREAEVLTWLAHGKTGGETATILDITEDAVRKHLKNIAVKLNTSSTTQSVALAVHSRQIRL